MKPPADLVGEETLWFAVQKQLRKQGTWANTDAPLLEAYVRSVALARTARASAVREPFVTGSRGQPVPHPGIRVTRDAESDARAVAADLLLTPAARRRAGIDLNSDADAFPFPLVS